MANNPHTIGRVYDAINRLRTNKNESLTSAAKREHTTTRTIKKVNKELDLLQFKERKPGHKYEFDISTSRTITFIDEDGIIHENIEVDKKSATNYSKYIYSIRDATTFGRGDVEFKRRANIGVRDIFGFRYKLLNDIDALLATLDTEGLDFDDLFYPER